MRIQLPLSSITVTCCAPYVPSTLEVWEAPAYVVNPSLIASVFSTKGVHLSPLLVAILIHPSRSFLLLQPFVAHADLH